MRRRHPSRRFAVTGSAASARHARAIHPHPASRERRGAGALAPLRRRRARATVMLPAGAVQEYIPPRPGVSPSNSEFETSSRVGAPGGRSSRVLLMGLKRSGKTSIYQVVFHKMSPHETLFLESTVKTVHHDVRNNSVVHFRVSDFPGSFSPSDDVCLCTCVCVCVCVCVWYLCIYVI